MDLKTANLSFTPAPMARIEVYVRDERRNLLQDTSMFYAPHEQYLQFGGAYGDYLSVYYRGIAQEDQLPMPKYRRREDAIVMRTGLNFPVFSTFASAEAGTTTDRIAGQQSPFRRLSLFTTFRPAYNHSYGFSAEYAKEQALFSGEVLERISGSATANIFIAQRTQLLACIYGSRTTRAPVQTYSMVDISVEHRFPFGHSILLRGRQSIFSPSSEVRELAYLLEYAVPLGIPLARVSAGGRLSGRLIDVESGKGIPDVVLAADGATTVSEDDGSFLFPSLRGDTLFLQLDMSAIGLDRIALEPIPKRVILGPGGEGVTR